MTDQHEPTFYATSVTNINDIGTDQEAYSLLAIF